MKAVRLILLLSLFTTTFSYGNIMIARNLGNTIVPMSETEVSMVAETVNIIHEKDGFEFIVYCEFYLKNMSDKPVVKDIAFPADKHAYIFSGFKAVVEEYGKTNTLSTTLHMTPENESSTSKASVANLSYPGYIVWNLKFQAGETKVVRCEYTMGEPADLGIEPFSGIQFKYIVKTGALWQGRIQNANISITFGDYAGYASSNVKMTYPDKAKWESANKRKLTWNFTNWEPSEDIIVSFTRWVGYETNNASFNEYLLPKSYQGSTDLYTASYLDELVKSEVQRVSRYYPERKLDRNFLRSIIAEHLFYDLFHKRGHKLGRSANLTLFDDKLHPGMTTPVRFRELSLNEQKNALFLVEYIMNDVVHEVPYENNPAAENIIKHNQQVDPIVTTPVDEVEAQGTQGHP